MQKNQISDSGQALTLTPGTRVLLTGASGFTGSVLARMLVKRGLRVRAIARASSDISALEDLEIEWFRGEVYDPQTLREAAQGVEYVFHVAAAFRNAGIVKEEYRRVHVESTQLLAEAVATQPQFKRFVLVSTMGVHGHIENPPGNEESPFAPGDEYQRTKLEAELYLREFAKKSQFPYTIIRPTGIFGPGDRRLLKVFKMATLPLFPVLGRGKCLYHLIHVNDLAEAIILAATHPAAQGEAFLVGNSEAISMLDVGRLVAHRLGRRFRVLRIPAQPFFVLADICEAICRPLGLNPPIYRRRVAFFTKDRSFDVSKIRGRLGFVPAESNESGILATADWYIKQGWLPEPKTSSTATQRILLIHPQPFFALRGSSLRSYTMIEALAALGYAVDVVSYGYGDSKELPRGVQLHRSAKIPGIRKIPIGPSLSKALCDVTLAWTAFRLLLRRNYLVIHGLEEGGILAALFSKIFRTPYVFDMHSHMSEQLRDHPNPIFKLAATPMQFIERLCIRGSSGVVTVSEQLSEFVRKNSPGTAVFTIHDAPLESATKVELQRAEALVHEFGLQDKQVMVYTGNFETYQGVELLLEGFAHLVHVIKPTYADSLLLLLVGGPADSKDEQRQSMREKLAQLGILNQVIFAGPRPPEEMGNFMHIAKALISPRLTGGNTPLKIYSYMAADAPIVATRVNSHTQVLGEEEAFLCEPSPEGIAQGLVDCFGECKDSLAKRILVSRNASNKLEASFTKENFLKKVRSLYSDILSQASSRAWIMIGNFPEIAEVLALV